ncbi:MAG: hypothetical protein V7724_05610 [Sediminicola sp.]
MVKNYVSPFFLLFSGLAICTLPLCAYGQDIAVLRVSDFDLKGPVRSCTVITDYGREEFLFNEDGTLAQSTTRYNETDYEVTTYKYKNGYIIEKRSENYREGEFDKNTSMASLYTLDTTDQKKITEKIISYNKELLYQYEYYYAADGQLSRIKRITNDGIDNTVLEYETYKGEQTISHFLNGDLIKSVRTSKTKEGSEEETTTVLTKEFIDGSPHSALEQTFNAQNDLALEKSFEYDETTKKFVVSKLKRFLYNKEGVLLELHTKTGPMEIVKKYLHQFDNGKEGNWVKQIVTPDNTYTTRRIEYFSKAE